MAKDKKSFIAYCDWGDIFNTLPDDKAGQLAKHLFSYVNDENPVTDDLVVNVSFASIKSSLKRDLKKYESYVKKQSDNGKKGGRPKKPTDSEKTQPFFEKPKKADSVSDSVSDSVNNNSYLNRVYFEKSKKVDEAFKDYLKLRKKCKYTMTDRAVNSLIKKLRELSGSNENKAIELIDNAILGKWKMFYSNESK